MQHEALKPVPRDALVRHIVSSLGRYWAQGQEVLHTLPIIERPFPAVLGPLRLAAVALPDWGRDLGVDGVLLVPEECCANSLRCDWDQVDWWLAAFLLLECWHERAWEQQHGVVHSYSLRLKGWDARAWERAWVNRFALFIRAWAAFLSRQSADVLFGPLPNPQILMTHDVDAVEKTLAIRVKQGAFLFFNSIRLLFRGQPKDAFGRAVQGMRFLFSRENWWAIPIMQELERAAGVRSRFHFYADERRKTPKRWLLDPAYDVNSARLSKLLSDLIDDGWSVGLHQSYDAWRSPELMQQQRVRLESASPAPVTSCRQHWLRFSWADTWRAQVNAGLEQDTTLMFNDRPGFRASAAIGWKPWDAAACQPHDMQALPTVLMDSHLYDYQVMSETERHAAITYWADETKAVCGEIAVLWHPHTLTNDYGWREGFAHLVGCVKRMSS